MCVQVAIAGYGSLPAVGSAAPAPRRVAFVIASLAALAIVACVGIAVAGYDQVGSTGWGCTERAGKSVCALNALSAHPYAMLALCFLSAVAYGTAEKCTGKLLMLLFVPCVIPLLVRSFMFVIVLCVCAPLQDEGLWDDGSVTLTQLNKSEMNSILNKASGMSATQVSPVSAYRSPSLASSPCFFFLVCALMICSYFCNPIFSFPDGPQRLPRMKPAPL